jgi:hypothetical protein
VSTPETQGPPPLRSGGGKRTRRYAQAGTLPALQPQSCARDIPRVPSPVGLAVCCAPPAYTALQPCRNPGEPWAPPRAGLACLHICCEPCPRDSRSHLHSTLEGAPVNRTPRKDGLAYGGGTSAFHSPPAPRRLGGKPGEPDLPMNPPKSRRSVTRPPCPPPHVPKHGHAPYVPILTRDAKIPAEHLLLTGVAWLDGRTARGLLQHDTADI